MVSDSYFMTHTVQMFQYLQFTVNRGFSVKSEIIVRTRSRTNDFRFMDKTVLSLSGIIFKYLTGPLKHLVHIPSTFLELSPGKRDFIETMDPRSDLADFRLQSEDKNFRNFFVRLFRIELFFLIFIQEKIRFEKFPWANFENFQ